MRGVKEAGVNKTEAINPFRLRAIQFPAYTLLIPLHEDVLYCDCDMNKYDRRY